MNTTQKCWWYQTTVWESTMAEQKAKPNRSKQVNLKRRAKMRGKLHNFSELQPKMKSVTSSPLRNEPMLNDGSLVDGLAGVTQCNMSKHFALHFSEYLEVIETSNAQQISKDKGLAKRLSFSMFSSNCIVLLWKKIYRVLAHMHMYEREYNATCQLIQGCAVPKDICSYLTHIGDFTDIKNRRYNLELIRELADLEIHGARGTFGRLDGRFHILYETMPSALIVLLKIKADYDYSYNNGPSDWDLPRELLPREPHPEGPASSVSRASAS